MTRPVRVLFVAGSLGGGGAERQLVDLLKHLDRRRIAPRLYLQYRRGELLPDVPADVPVDAFWDGVSQRSLIQRSFAKLRCPCAARALHLREVLAGQPVDVIMSWSLMCVYETALATRGRRLPHIGYIIVEPQSEVDDVFPRGFPFRRQLARWAYRSTTKVLANSAALRDETARQFDLSERRVGTFFNARDFERIDRMAAEETPCWPGAGRRVVAVGRLNAQKGFDVLLRAFAQAHDPSGPLQLAILGQGPEDAALRGLAGELGIRDQVHFLGFQQNPYGYLRTADLFVLTSHYEGLPNVLIEALACRVPVVATDCPTGPREILQDGKFGPLVPVDDAGALAAAMRLVLASPPSADLRETARQSMLERYDIRTCIRDLEDLFCDVAAQRTNCAESSS